MPELPEVTTITNQLKKELTGKIVVSVFVNPGYNVYPSSEGVVENVSGAKVCDVFRVAKVIVIKIKKDLEEKYVAIHLAMTGRIKFLESKNVFQNISQDVSHLLVMNFDNKSQIVFTDQRRFGYVKLLSGVEFEELKNKYGPDSLEVNVTEFEKRLKVKTRI
ncbi:MAG: DNA-formamidopyrimidine glycosylase family protein [bacterium]